MTNNPTTRKNTTMPTTKEITNALRAVTQGAAGMNYRDPASKFYSFIQAEGLTVPSSFMETATKATEIVANINTATNPPTANLLDVASDPKKLDAYLVATAKANSMTRVIRQQILTEVQAMLARATQEAANEALQQFVNDNADSGAYTSTPGTPGQQLVAQESRDRLNRIHTTLITTATGGTPNDDDAAVSFRWEYTADQWAEMNSIYHWDYSQHQWANFVRDNPSWEKPSVDEAAIRVGATHRFASSYAEALDNAEQCGDEVERRERDAKREAQGLWVDPKPERGHTARVD